MQPSPSGMRPALLSAVALCCASVVVVAAERRAAAPKFESDAFRDTFFDSADQAIRGERPKLGQGLAPAAAAPAGRDAGSPEQASESSTESTFTKLITPQSLEDEIKRVRLQFDAVITTPTAFNSGGFVDARQYLTALASLFAVVTEHGGDVRWKSDAAAARDLLARSAFNCKSGSAQVYNEAKLRKEDLELLVTGSGLADREAEPENEWDMIADRGPLMYYLEELLEDILKDLAREADTVQAEGDQIRQAAETVAVVGQILRSEGSIDWDDEDYAEHCGEMIDASASVVRGLEADDPEAVWSGVTAIQQACTHCHENYR